MTGLGRAAFRAEALTNNATTAPGMERNIGTLQNNTTGALSQSAPNIGGKDSGSTCDRPLWQPHLVLLALLIAIIILTASG